ncbi:hypothetical protein [Campylobacter fetus]|uniref:hypothetical protein n=1 Tax=Campylobacter fetus TaxID=196 RepID=UPI0003C2AB5C|nr:hypothetical protein [Campylobacter fetus]AGZ81203.1 putative membrane protein [Campylobacter fetus subsp. testudinum 03-427]EAI4321603.1 hypothetical protein [Campylobacter fetus]EAI4391457.1 hypothetical protein [Campylobacter fetus]OCS07234.1 hypothetical protein CFTD6659_02315 [Campylobacter fetus subsp. testudinum]OCS08859.1 hypothetical protein CFTD6683_02100 [Campylobacter fetus subsp. testudinum]
METVGFILLAIFVGIPVGIFLLKAILMTFSSAVYTAVAEDTEEKAQGILIAIFGIICVVGAIAILMFIF